MHAGGKFSDKKKAIEDAMVRYEKNLQSIYGTH